MPFDGVNYTSAPIIGPYAYHPHAPATPDVLAAVLQQSYFSCRYSNGLVGIQTYRITLDDGGMYDHEHLVATDTTYVPIAKFKRVLPPWATHLGFSAVLQNVGSGHVQVIARIRATDGTDSCTGTATTQEAPVFVRGQFVDQSRFDPTTNALVTVSGSVALGNVNALSTIIVEAYAVNTVGDATGFTPELITCWWESRN